MGDTMTYEEFLNGKRQIAGSFGFTPKKLPDFLFDFQKFLLEWQIQQGRSAIFADCGLGKTPMQLAWADAIVHHTNKRVLILTPLAVSGQTIHEGEKFGIECHRSKDGTRLSAITVTNYERLHHFNPHDFIGVVCDESSILKNFEGATKDAITEFMRIVPYRMLCTATASPNDYIELGTSSEALGGLGYMDMLGMFFKNDQNSLHPATRTRHHGLNMSGQWRFKPHAEHPFWQWVASWSRAIRKPSDYGFQDGKFILPELVTRQHIVNASRPLDGYLFTVPAHGLAEQRSERRHTITERCEKAAELVRDSLCYVAWCHLNQEGDLLEKLMPGAAQISGKDSDDEKEEKFEAFSSGQIRGLITKPSIAGWGLNWQHCRHMTMFPSHSFEQYYQSVRRCWRFGQTSPVTVDVITTEGESNVMQNLLRKSEASDKMFTMIVQHMNEAIARKNHHRANTNTEVPSWLSSINA